MKKCSKCHTPRPEIEFSKYARSPDGLRANCKHCARAAHAAWKLANPELAKARAKKYREEHPDKVRQAQAAWVARNPGKRTERVRAWREANPEQAERVAAAYRAKTAASRRAYSAAWYAANPERAAATVRAYRAANPEAFRIHNHNSRARRRARERGGKLSPHLLMDLYIAQEGKCACCGKPLGTTYHLDHKMPLALGGKHCDDNIQLLLPRCNLVKGAKHPNEWAKTK
jgi:5-methylcytosine-specific restriction endonuclease McrA